MAIKKIKEDIYNIGAIDWDRELFDELIPLPEGTSYNSYVVFGSEKTALIDAV
ncbi:MAG: FprA family A-type flavoprotein, partial [Thermotogota bacterium]